MPRLKLALVAKARADVAINFQHREAEAQAVCAQIEGLSRRAQHCWYPAPNDATSEKANEVVWSSRPADSKS